MMKKGFLSLILASISFANEPEHHSPAKKVCLSEGFYVGAAGGYDWNSLHRHLVATTLDDPLLHVNQFVDPNGFMGSLFVGYGRNFIKKIYVGVEVFGNLSSANEKTSTQFIEPTGEYTYVSKISTDYSYGISLLPGFRSSDRTLLYVRLGYIRARFKENEVDSFSGAPAGMPFLNSTKVKFTNGYSFGFGFEEAIYSQLSIRGEFTHAIYQSVNHNFTSFVSSTATKIEPSANQLTLSLIWHIF